MTIETAAKRLVDSIESLEMCGEHIPDDIRARLQELSEKSFTVDTIYPSVGISNGTDVGLHWIAAERSMELELFPLGAWHFHAANGGSHFTMEGRGELPFEALRLQFEDFSQFVEQRNPNWRITLSRS